MCDERSVKEGSSQGPHISLGRIFLKWKSQVQLEDAIHRTVEYFRKVLLFILSVWFGWLNLTNQMNKTNQINQINPPPALDRIETCAVSCPCPNVMR
jgi:hypothetical protein